MNADSQPLISIIIPVYNAEKYIAATLNSALNQTYPNIEVLVVDDGSTDNSLPIAKTFEAYNVKILQQLNKGASAARNNGLAAAKGLYIQFLDADDLLKDNKLATQAAQLAGKTDTLSICPVIHFNDSATQPLSIKPTANELSFYRDYDDPSEFLVKLYGVEHNTNGMIGVHSWLTPADLIKKAGNWNETLTINDDGEFFCRVVLQSARILATTQTACYYRKFSDKSSLSAQKDEVSLLSQYHSISLRNEHLTAFRTDERIQQIAVRELMDLLMIAYPGHRQLSKKILAEAKQYNLHLNAPKLGGRIIEWIKTVFGWKTARTLQYYLAKILRNRP